MWQSSRVPLELCTWAWSSRMPADKARVALKYWFPATLFPVELSRKKAELWAPMWVMLSYFRWHKSFELLQTTVAVDEEAGSVAVLNVVVVVVADARVEEALEPLSPGPPACGDANAMAERDSSAVTMPGIVYRMILFLAGSGGQCLQRQETVEESSRG